MRQLRLEKRKSLPSWWALIFLALCCGASLFVTFRASAQTTTTAPTVGKALPPPGSADRRSKPEESATIPDDPTLVPDDKESADNNVTFPVDI